MARRSPADLQRAKEARQKKIAIVGGVLLLAIVAFQAPRTMKLLNGADETVAAPPPATTEAAPPAATTAPAPAPADAGGASASPDAGPQPAGGQLVSFTRFASKDPFVQQIDPSAAAPAGAPGGVEEPAPAVEEGTVVPAAGAGGGSEPTTGGGEGPALAVAPDVATIAVNDLEETVAVGSEFPSGAPLFRLVKLTKSTAQVAIAGGSYASGEPTATLRLGRTLVLQNTADGTSFELRLVEVR